MHFSIQSLLSFSFVFFCKATWKHLRTCVRLATRLEDRLFIGSRISYQNLRKKKFKGLLSLVGYLVHLRHSWQNEENDKGSSMGLRIKRFEYRKFLWAVNEIAHNFATSRKAMENTIEDLANMIVFLLVRNFISIHAKTWSVFVSKEIVQWPSGTLLPGFDHMLILSVWIRYFVTEVHWVKFHHRIHWSF